MNQLLFAGFLALVGGWATPAVAQPAQYRAAQDSLTAELGTLRGQGYFNGFGVAIVSRQGVLYQHGFGLVDVQAGKVYSIHTVQNIGSVSKTVVGLALLKAQELGKLQLDDPVNKYLPFRVVNPNFSEVPTTIQQLATHTSSIRDNDFYLSKNYYLKPGQNLTVLPLAFEDEQTFVPADSAVALPVFLQNVLTPQGKWYQPKGFLNRRPGELYEYSNMATALAAYIIERACGQPFPRFTARYITKPQHLRDSGWSFGEIDFSRYSRLYQSPTVPLPYYGLTTYPDGNFISSVADLGTYLHELLRGYYGQGTVLTPASYRELFRPELTAKNFESRNECNPYNESYNVGIFMAFGYTSYVGHTGGDPGVVTLLFFDLKSGISRVLLLNTNLAARAGGTTIFKIWDTLVRYQHRVVS
ncbi:serine hydrolase [Hymenobacter sp. HMF4947]|uniref:Serine hydrolase n=1 Tax=Hymenobacter ginkgonis TaxID=2682976 RepID=A0A7K1TGQ9_9BACT|nr:serine hydrolase domain-containing protein [Hymenobacter ginkgonis]MVN77597.1 serine hydrolase [Hymenobacter ginkgonis]